MEKQNWKLYVEGKLETICENRTEEHMEKFVKALSSTKIVPSLNIPNPYYGKNIKYEKTDEIPSFVPIVGVPGR